jgi:hypothetical protein
MGKDLRLEFMLKLRLSVEAMGRREENISARLKAGICGGGKGVCTGAEDAMEPAEERRVTSKAVVS